MNNTERFTLQKGIENKYNTMNFTIESPIDLIIIKKRKTQDQKTIEKDIIKIIDQELQKAFKNLKL